MKTYEAMVIFPSRLKDDEMETVVGRTRADIERVGGKVTGLKKIGKRTFARPLHKQDTGIYAWIAFDAEPSAIAALRQRFRLNEDVFRVQILTADKRTLAKYNAAAEEPAEEAPRTQPNED